MKRYRTRVQKACRANFVTFNKAELPRPWVRCVWEAATKYTKKTDVSDKRPLKTIEKPVVFEAFGVRMLKNHLFLKPPG